MFDIYLIVLRDTSNCCFYSRPQLYHHPDSVLYYPQAFWTLISLQERGLTIHGRPVWQSIQLADFQTGLPWMVGRDTSSTIARVAGGLGVTTSGTWPGSVRRSPPTLQSVLEMEVILAGGLVEYFVDKLWWRLHETCLFFSRTEVSWWSRQGPVKIAFRFLLFQSVCSIIQCPVLVLVLVLVRNAFD